MARARAPKVALAAVVAVAVAASAAWLLFVHELERQVLRALGPRATVGRIEYRYPTLVLSDVRITADGAPYAWPAEDEATAERVAFETSLRALWDARGGRMLRVANVQVEGATLSMLRTPGHLMLLPALRQQARDKAAGRPEGPARVESVSSVESDAAPGPAAAPQPSAAPRPTGTPGPEMKPGPAAAPGPTAPPGPDTTAGPAAALGPAAGHAGSGAALAARPASPLTYGALYPRPGPPSGVPPAAERPVTLLIEHVHLERVEAAVYDATLDRQKPYRVEFIDGRADIGNIALPGLAEPMTLDLHGALKGPGDSAAPVSVQGTFAPGEHDADLALSLTGGSVAALEPYLLRSGEGGVKSGRMDLQLDAHVRQGQVRAPGRLTITGLQFDDSGGTFAGVERRAVIAALTKNGRLDVNFTLEGRLEDPRFKLNENLGGRIAVGLAAAVGVSVKNAVESVGDAIGGLLGGGTSKRKP